VLSLPSSAGCEDQGDHRVKQPSHRRGGHNQAGPDATKLVTDGAAHEFAHSFVKAFHRAALAHLTQDPPTARPGGIKEVCLRKPRAGDVNAKRPHSALRHRIEVGILAEMSVARFLRTALHVADWDRINLR